MSALDIMVVAFALVVGTLAATIFGTIFLSNRMGNYEKALPICFWLGLFGNVLLLAWQPSGVAVVTAAYWILGLSGLLVLGWLCLVLSRR